MTHTDDQKVVSWRRRLKFCSPVKPHCTEVGPTSVRLVNPRYTAYPMGIRKAEGEPFTVTLSTWLNAGVVTVYRKN